MSNILIQEKIIITRTDKLNSGNSARLMDYICVLPQYLIPQHLFSRLIYRITRCEWSFIKNSLIRLFITWFKVDMSIAAEPDYHNYRHFNEFFTRPLRPGSRPIAEGNNIIISPIDGTISQVGRIVSGEIFQAKNRYFDLQSLLADENKLVNFFQEGLFTTLYLSPRDYHRIHMPIDGKLLKMIYVPGRLFAVNNHTTRIVNRLFARNERVISIFGTNAGLMSIIMVGAINVSGMETVWAGEITPAADRTITRIDYHDQPLINLAKGQEIGRFNMGSTVIVLFGRDAVNWNSDLQANSMLTMGMELGQLVNT
jgi:phosphatidylserine decarboxylase